MKHVCTLIVIVLATVALFPRAAQSSRSTTASARRPHLMHASQPIRQRVAPPDRPLQAPTPLPSAELKAFLPTRAISIPYGFDPPLILHDMGQRLLVDGHGGCAAGHIVIVELTITQTTSLAFANGQVQMACTGELQHWNADVAATVPGRFMPGPGYACGLATTQLDGVETDSFEWCRDITIAANTYLPIIIRDTPAHR